MFFQSRKLSTLSQHLKNHYEALGVSQSATQSDIKAAYYKLSLQYHPDRNKGCDKAAEKFRAITAAYEILGNYRSRKMYDKGIIAGEDFSGNQDLSTHSTYTGKYSAHQQRPPMPTGRTQIYDFDEWSRVHYGMSFARRNSAKARYEEKVNVQSKKIMAGRKENVIISVVFILAAFCAMQFIFQGNLDDKKVSHEKTANK